jgi:hypothetical protein
MVRKAIRGGSAQRFVTLDRMCDMQRRELRWGDPFHPATPEELAAMATTLLLYGVQVMISMPRR